MMPVTAPARNLHSGQVAALPGDVVPVPSAVAWVMTLVARQIVQHVHLYRAGVWRSPAELFRTPPVR